MAMPCERASSRHTTNHIEQRPECVLMALFYSAWSGTPSYMKVKGFGPRM
jgi:hypothetical protein